VGTKNNSEITPKSNYTAKHLVVVAVVAAMVCSVMTAALLGGVIYVKSLIDTDNRQAQRQTIVEEGGVIADIAAELSPSVVSVRTRQSSSSGGYNLSDQNVSEGAGTGIIVNKDGLILTNKHVIPSGTDSVQVTLADGTVYEDVTILGRDPLNDLALLQIRNPKKLTPAKLGNSDSVRTGEKVIAIGNALGEFQNTVTSGIISGIGRPIQASDGSGSSETLTNLFQTDAAINPGNSGGPLVNFNGEVIGVNTAIAEGAEGLGFSIPINEAKSVISSAEETGKISRAYIGVRYVMLNPDLSKQIGLKVQQGAYIDTKTGSVVKGSPASKAGLQPGDVITEINDTKISDTKSLTSVVSAYKVGDTVNLTVVRDGKTQTIKLKLGEAPAS